MSAGGARRMLAEALNLEMTLEKARELVRAGVNAKKQVYPKCPNCGKSVPVEVEDWEKRARFVQIVADQGLGKAREANEENPLEKLEAEVSKMSDEELERWLADGGTAS